MYSKYAWTTECCEPSIQPSKIEINVFLNVILSDQASLNCSIQINLPDSEQGIFCTSGNEKCMYVVIINSNNFIKFITFIK